MDFRKRDASPGDPSSACSDGATYPSQELGPPDRVGMSSSKTSQNMLSSLGGAGSFHGRGAGGEKQARGRLIRRSHTRQRAAAGRRAAISACNRATPADIAALLKQLHSRRLKAELAGRAEKPGATGNERSAAPRSRTPAPTKRSVKTRRAPESSVHAGRGLPETVGPDSPREATLKHLA